MKNREPIDDYFKEKLTGLKVEPSQQVWERVAAHQNRKSRPLIGLWMRAASIALLLGLGIWYFYPTATKLPQSNTLPAKNGAGPAEKPLTEELLSTSKPRVEEASAAIASSESQPANSAQENETAYLGQKLFTPAEVNEIALAAELDAEASLRNLSVALKAVESPKSQRYAIELRLPVTRQLQKEDSLAKAKPSNLWSYASGQFNRILEGEKPQLPAQLRNPRLSIDIPEILNKK